MIGTVVQPRSPWMTSTPSMSGRPRSSTTRSGWPVGGLAQRGGAVGGDVDLVVAGAQVDPQGAQDLRLVVDDEDAGHVRLLRPRRARPVGGRRAAGSAAIMVSPPPGVSSGSSVPPIASARPRDRARPSPTPVCVVAVAEPLERQEDPVARPRRDAGAAVDDPQLDLVAVRAGGDRAAAARAGCSAAALAMRLTRTRSSSAGSAQHLGQVVGDVGRDVGRPAGRGRRGRAGRPPPAPIGCGVHAERAGLQPAHVEQVRRPAGRAGPATRRRWPAARRGPRRRPVDVVAAQAARPRPWPRPAGCAGRG